MVVQILIWCCKFSKYVLHYQFSRLCCYVGIEISIKHIKLWFYVQWNRLGSIVDSWALLSTTGSYFLLWKWNNSKLLTMNVGKARVKIKKPIICPCAKRKNLEAKHARLSDFNHGLNKFSCVPVAILHDCRFLGMCRHIPGYILNYVILIYVY